ncbi:unnamed protein product [Allacma fusca]|uniref:Uncharacterized protein n=1 Tax=Allacma fusca TaxID=39272 RepID=A0A8J2L424_9HEXA|nr:unnamed protein product [Allacma fusca]
MALSFVVFVVASALGISGLQFPSFASISVADPRSVVSSLAAAPASSLSKVPGVNQLSNFTNSAASKLNPGVAFPTVATINISLDFGNDVEFSEEALKKAVANYIPDVSLISDDPNLIRFLLFSKRFGPDAPELLTFQDEDSIENSQFDPSKPTKFLVHGFQQNYNSSYPQNVKNDSGNCGKILEDVLTCNYP